MMDAGGVGHPIWHVAGQEPARMMNGGPCEDSDTNLQVDYISLLQNMLPPRKPSGPFSILYHTNTSYISSPWSIEGGGCSSSQVVSPIFFFSFNFRCEYWCQSGEGHRHRTLRHLLQPPAALLQQPCMKPAICKTSPC